MKLILSLKTASSERQLTIVLRVLIRFRNAIFNLIRVLNCFQMKNYFGNVAENF